MKKTIALILAMLMCISLCACATDGGSGKSTEKNKGEDYIDISFKDTNVLPDTAELTFSYAFATDTLTPPIASGTYTDYQADSGKVFLVLAADVKNISEKSVDVSSVFEASIKIGGEKIPASFYLIEDGGSSISEYGDIDALSTAAVYIAFSVDSDAVDEPFTLTLKDNDGNKYRGEFTLASMKGDDKVVLGKAISTDNFELTVNDVYFDAALYPPHASGYYHHFEAADGKTYLIISCSVKNLKGTDLKYDSIAGVSCVYNEKYRYDSILVIEEEGGVDLDEYLHIYSYSSSNKYSISPLDSGNLYYLIEMPQEVETGSIVISIRVANECYTYSVSA